MSDSQLISDFFSRDVLLGDRALKAAVADRGEEALRLFIPEQEGYGASGLQIEQRLAKLAASIGANAVDYLIRVIRNRSWGSMLSAAPAFAGLREHKQRATERLVDVLKQGEIDSQRLAIEALGYLGADDLAFSITEFAETGEWIPQRDYWRQPSRYHLDKFCFYVVQALIRMTASLTSVDAISRCLRQFRDFLPICDKVLGQNRISDWDVRFVAHNFPLRAADPLVSDWIASDSHFLQECGVEALGHLRLSRTSAFLLSVLEDPRFNDSVRKTAGISLSEIADAGAAAKLAERLNSASDSPGFSWAFASLYAHDVAWPVCDEFVEELLGQENNDSEISAHMIYSLACRGDARAERSFSALNSPHLHMRGTGAIACARFNPESAREALFGRDEEASNPMELACILAAQIHAGHVEKIDSLHQALTTFGELPILRPIWKREVLYAFFVAEGSDSERGRLWCEAAWETPRRVVTEMQALLKRRAREVSVNRLPRSQAELASAASRESQEVNDKFDVFISHASEDKLNLAEPLYHALVAAGVTVWFDKTELKLGDGLRRKIDEGLVRCRYGIVILSPSFLAKQWPQNELGALMARETVSGAKAILPIWHDLSVEELLRHAPMLADRLACRSSEDMNSIVAKILDVLKE